MPTLRVRVVASYAPTERSPIGFPSTVHSDDVVRIVWDLIGLLVAETPNLTELCTTSFRLAGSPVVLTVQARHAAASARREPIRYFHPAGHVMQPQERINGAGRVAARID